MNLSTYMSFDGYPDDRLISAAMKSFGVEVDQFETDLFNKLLSESIIKLTAALAKDDCGSQFRDVSKTLSKLTTVSFGCYKRIKEIIKDSAIVIDGRGPRVAIYNPVTKSINLNRTFNWVNPNGSIATHDGAIILMGDILGGASASTRRQ